MVQAPPGGMPPSHPLVQDRVVLHQEDWLEQAGGEVRRVQEGPNRMGATAPSQGGPEVPPLAEGPENSVNRLSAGQRAGEGPRHAMSGVLQVRPWEHSMAGVSRQARTEALHANPAWHTILLVSWHARPEGLHCMPTWHKLADTPWQDRRLGFHSSPRVHRVAAVGMEAPALGESPARAASQAPQLGVPVIPRAEAAPR